MSSHFQLNLPSLKVNFSVPMQFGVEKRSRNETVQMNLVMHLTFDHG